MPVDRISIKALVIGVILILGLVPIAHTFVAKVHFRDAALQSKVKSLSRVLEVATRELLHQMHHEVTATAMAIQARPAVREALPAALGGDRTALAAALADPLEKGFATARTLDLVALRAYDTDYRPLMHSSRSPLLGDALPTVLARRVTHRSGTERLKAVGTLWAGDAGVYYSVLVPIGGLRAVGYLELIVDPLFTLRRVGEMVDMPVAVRDSAGHTLLGSTGPDETSAAHLPVTYTLRADEDAIAYHIVAFEDVAELYSDMHSAQVFITFWFLVFTAVVMALSVWLLGRFVVSPIQILARQMAQCTDGNLTVRMSGHCLRELRVLHDAFNGMTGKLQQRTERLEHLTQVDALTGVANRRRFDESLEQEWKRAQRNGFPLSLLLVDVDYFKAFNDRYGHPAGDRCLQRVAGALSAAASRPADQVARYGGEEFAVILPETAAAGARQVAERLVAAISDLRITHESSLVNRVLTVSIGIATLVPQGDTRPARLVEAADRALYRAKANGRDRVEMA